MITEDFEFVYQFGYDSIFYPNMGPSNLSFFNLRLQIKIRVFYLRYRKFFPLGKIEKKFRHDEEQNHSI